MDWRSTSPGRVIFFAAGDGLDRAARDRSPGAGQDLRRQDHAVLRRIRPHAVVPPPTARPSTGSSSSRSAATSASSACSRPPQPSRPGRAAYSTGPFRALADNARAAEWHDISPEDEGRLFYQKKSWQKLIIMAGGPTMNILLAFVILLGVSLQVRGLPVPAHGQPRPGVHRRGDRDRPDCDGKPPTPGGPVRHPGRRPDRRLQRESGRPPGTRSRR